MKNNIKDLLIEDVSLDCNCNWCKESSLKVGEKSNYGAVVIYKIGTSLENGWFATLSPKTGGDPEKDFTVQLMTFAHLTHFSQLERYPELAKNYGVAFSKLCSAVTQIMADDLPEFKAMEELNDQATSVATYGKSTNWKEKKEHFHIKIFPFKRDIGQPYTVDSSFGRKEVFKDENGNEFIKMNPVKKVMINKERFDKLCEKFISLLNLHQRV
jgi:hypothetical protein